MSVTYHKAVKRISGHNVWDSNHDACETAGVYVFKHLLAKRMLCFWHNLTKSRSLCLGNLRYYFRHSSSIFQKLSKLFYEVYSVDILSNPMMCINITNWTYSENGAKKSLYSCTIVPFYIKAIYSLKENRLPFIFHDEQLKPVGAGTILVRPAVKKLAGCAYGFFGNIVMLVFFYIV